MARSPLYDIYDPYGTIEQRERLLGERATISDLLPEEEKSGLLRSLSQVGASGLSTVGWLLDTPGALVRGILAGKPLSGFGSSEDRVSGRDLLRQYGMVGDEDNWGNFSGGVAAEMLLDPLTYGTLGLSTLFGTGARGAAGRAAHLAGLTRDAALDSVAHLNPLRTAADLQPYDDAFKTPRVREYLRRQTARGQLDTIQDAAERTAREGRLMHQYQRMGLPPETIDQPLAVLDEFRLPWQSRGYEIGGGALGDYVAETADRIGNWTKTAPVIGQATRTAAAIFDPSVGGRSSIDRDLELTNDIQVTNRQAAAAKRNQQEAVRRYWTDLQQRALEARAPQVTTIPDGSGGFLPVPQDLQQFNSRSIWNALADYAESPSLLGPTPSGVPLGKTTGDAVSDWVLQNVPEFRNVRDAYVDMAGRARTAAENAGIANPELRSIHGNEFVPRQLYWWQQERPPVRPGAQVYREKPWSRNQRMFSTADNFGRQRDPAYDIEGGIRTFRRLTSGADPRIDSAALQRSLINSPDAATTRSILDDAFTNGLQYQRPYQQAYDQLTHSDAYLNAPILEQQEMLDALTRDVDQRYERLANLLRSADQQFAENGVGIFDSPSFSNVVRYDLGQAVNRTNADALFDELLRRSEDIPSTQIQGGVNVPLADAARRLGFDADNFRRRWQAAAGGDVTNYSINERFINALASLSPKSQASQPIGDIGRVFDSYTNAWKSLALAWPAFHTRNLYSGSINAASLSAFNPIDQWAAFQASRGNYGPIGERLAGAYGYDQIADPAERARRFLAETGAQNIASGNVLDDVTGGPDMTIRSMFTGGDNSLTRQPRQNRGLMDRLNDFFSMRGVGILQNAPSINTNPILAMNDVIGQRVEDTLRTGTFLNQVRKGVAPEIAGDITRMAQVDYSPQAFTADERMFLKRLMPFYSFQKGILPSIGENLAYRPGGLNSQLVRAVTRASEPSEDNFVPDYMRASAAIPLPDGLFGSSGDGLQRFLTNIDLPFESTFNLFTPGVGGTLTSTVADTLRNTGSNLAGQLHPAIKGPLEFITNRQLYTGRQLSDLYSVLERDMGAIGRPLEQAVTSMAPFGSRALGLYRQLTDDRLDPASKYGKIAFNLLAGMKVTDIDEERTRQMAARNVLDKMLESTPGVRVYDNLAVPTETLQGMPEDQQKLYLLYKVLQSDAAKRARERRKAEQDPLAILGVR